MDEPVDFTLSDKGQLLVVRNLLEESLATLAHLQRATLDLREYALQVEGTPDVEQWATVLELIGEVRDAYGLRSADR